MMEPEWWWNGQIKQTYLGSDDHGGFTFTIQVEGDDQGQHIGNYCLRDVDEYQAWGLEMIAEILRVVGVDAWEKLPGKFIRVKSSHNFEQISHDMFRYQISLGRETSLELYEYEWKELYSALHSGNTGMNFDKKE